MLCLKCGSEIAETNINPYGLHDACFTTWFEVPPTAEFKSLDLKKNEPSEPQDQNQYHSSFFHGKFKKYSAILGEKSYILKMRDAETPELPEIEYLCNQIGKLLGIPVAEFYIIRFYDELVFVTKNFIQSKSPANLQHIYHFMPSMEFTFETLIQIVKNQTRQPHDVIILIKTILFDALIGNHDRHGRNLAFIIKSNGIKLSPIYDNVSFLGLQQGFWLKVDFNPSGKISTLHSNEPKMKDYILELKRLGYHDEIKKFSSNIKLIAIDKLIENSFCSAFMKEAMQKLIHKRFEEMKNEI